MILYLPLFDWCLELNFDTVPDINIGSLYSLLCEQFDLLQTEKSIMLCRCCPVPISDRATVAQVVEQLIRNQQASGSSPLGGSSKNKGFRNIF